MRYEKAGLPLVQERGTARTYSPVTTSAGRSCARPRRHRSSAPRLGSGVRPPARLSRRANPRGRTRWLSPSDSRRRPSSHGARRLARGRRCAKHGDSLEPAGRTAKLCVALLAPCRATRPRPPLGEPTARRPAGRSAWEVVAGTPEALHSAVLEGPGARNRQGLDGRPRPPGSRPPYLWGIVTATGMWPTTLI